MRFPRGIALTAQLAAPSHVRCKAPHNSVRDACGIDPDRGAGSAGSARREELALLSNLSALQWAIR